MFQSIRAAFWMNWSAVDPKNCTSEVDSYTGGNIAFPVTSSLFGILGNVIALYSLWQPGCGSLGRRKVFYVLVTGLVWADLLGILVTTPPVLAVYATGHWVGADMLCNGHAFSMVLFGLITPLIVGAMSVERVLAVRYAYYHARYCTPTHARRVLVALWIAACGFSSLPLMGLGHFSMQYPCTWCFLNIHPQVPLDVYYACTYAVVNLVIIMLTIASNLLVQGTLLKVRRQWQNLNFRRTEGRVKDLEAQMLVLLLVVSANFALCWAPFMIRILRNQWDKEELDHAGDLLAVRLTSFHQLVDPWLYILCRKLTQFYNPKTGSLCCFFCFSRTEAVSARFEDLNRSCKILHLELTEIKPDLNKIEQHI